MMSKDDALAQLRESIKPGDTVRTILRHVSASGMTRWISLIVIGKDGSVWDASYAAAVALGWRVNTRNHEGVEVGGCGMDMGFHLVYGLSLALYPEYACLDSGHLSDVWRCLRCDRVIREKDGTWRTTGFRGDGECYGGDGAGQHVPGSRPLSYGAHCPSNYHVNGGEAGGEPVHHDGYAISHKWL